MSNDEHKFCIYCDEASINDGRYMFIGGLWIPQTQVANVQAQITAYRQSQSLTREMKWKKTSDPYLQRYCGFVDIFFRNPALCFNCIAVEKSIVDYKTFHNSDKELGFYKFYYLLISRRLQPGNVYYLYTDQRTTRTADTLDTLKDVTNKWCLREKGVAPLKLVEPRHSHNEDLIQMADVLLGAIAYRWNNHDGSKAKLALCAHIEARLGWKSLFTQTYPTEPKFNIWYWRPKAP